MKTFDLNCAKRENAGTKFAKLIRQEGNVPCVVYGNCEHIDFTVTQKEVSGAVFTPEVYLVNLNIDGKIIPSIIKDLQFHPVTDEILHIDFYAVAEDKPVKVKLPVEIEGHAPGVKAGGKLVISSRKLTAFGTVSTIPDSIKVDISNLELEKSIKVGDLSFENFKIADPKDMLVCRVKATRATAASETAAASDKKKK